MLQRKAWGELEDWFRYGQGKAVVVKGARQVGKSYLVDRFAEQAFASVAKFDLLENASVRKSLSRAQSAEDLMLRISVASTTPLKEGETAIVIDEIQECPNLLTYLKYLVQEGKYRFLVTGSLLGVMLENIDSLPVGYVRQITMHPLDFEEFCWANGVGAEGFSLAISCLKREEPFPDFLYDRLRGLFHRYLMVGGMPDAVNAYLSTNNVDEVRQVHHDLHSLYRTDITKYAPRELRLLIRDIYNLIPSEVTAQNKRFRLSSLKDVKRFDQVQQHFLWRRSARLQRGGPDRPSSRERAEKSFQVVLSRFRHAVFVVSQKSLRGSFGWEVILQHGAGLRSVRGSRDRVSWPRSEVLHLEKDRGNRFSRRAAGWDD
mgnify:CR=1 FL=1